MRDLTSDVRLALRTLSKAPVFFLASVVTLALTIGASTAVFSVVDPLLIRKLPIVDPDRLIMLKSSGSLQTNDVWWPGAFERFASATNVLEGAFAIAGPTAATLSIEGRTEPVSVATVTPTFFTVLGVRLGVGRAFTAEGSAVVLSHAYWRRRWNADAGVVGRTLAIDGIQQTVLGVAPQDFRGIDVGAEPDVYAAVRPDARPDWMQVFGRLRPGVTPAQARAALEVPFQAAVAESQIPAVERPQALAHLIVQSAARGVSDIRDRYDRAGWTLMVMVMLVWLVGCANVANLAFTQAAGRRRDFAVRRALGASQARLMRHVLIEASIVALLGAAAGLLLAKWARPVLMTAMATGGRALTLDVGIDGRVAAFAAATLVLAAAISGVLPAWEASRSNPAESLGIRDVGLEGGRHAARWTGAMIVAQIALSVALMAGAVLMARSLLNLLTHDVGFDASRVLAVSIDGTSRPGSIRYFGDDVLGLIDRLSAVPGVESVGFGGVTPISGRLVGVNVAVDDTPPGPQAYTLLTSVSPRYFQTLGVPVLAGRDFDRRDLTDMAGVMINQTLARRLFAVESAVGRRIRFVEGNRPAMPIIGVVADSTFGSVREAPQAALYSPAHLTGSDFPRATLLVRSRQGAAESLAGAVERTVRLAVPTATVREIRTIRSRIGESVRGERLVALLLTGFSASALVVTAIGLFGALSAMLARRTREIGLRIALGADRPRIVRLILGPVTGILAAGLVLGLGGALLSGRFLTALLFGITGTDVVSLISVGLVLAVAVAGACLNPVLRATRIDPAELFRG